MLGYIEAEAVTVQPFEAFLWPQRFYSNFTLSSFPCPALLMPMGGPMHKAALKTLDAAFQNGLFKGTDQGHMLGTAFFRPFRWTYTMHGRGEQESHTKQLRNCVWVRALSHVSRPPLGPGPTGDGSGAHLEKGHSPRKVRAKVVVLHLTLSKATAKDKSSSLPFVSEKAGSPGLRVISRHNLH